MQRSNGVSKKQCLPIVKETNKKRLWKRWYVQHKKKQATLKTLLTLAPSIKGLTPYLDKLASYQKQFALGVLKQYESKPQQLQAKMLVSLQQSHKAISLVRGQLSTISNELADVWLQLSIIAIISCFWALLVAILIVYFWGRNKTWERDYTALQESEAHNKAILRSLADMTIVINRQLEALEVNIGEDNPLGLTHELVCPLPLETFFPERLLTVFTAALQNLTPFQPHQRIEYTANDNDSFLTLEARLTRVDDERHLAIIRDITEQKQNERLKDEFIANVSHELRTPLTSIRGALSLLRFQFGEEFKDSAQKLLFIAEKNSLQLNRLIDDLLDVQKMTYGQLDFDLEDVELNQLLEGVIENNKPYAEKHDVQFRFFPLPSALWCQTAPKRLEQILNNLLSNAAKFSNPKSYVDVRLQPKERTFLIEVQDYGIGISKQFQRKLFRKFSQAGNTSNKNAGTGLGLNISLRWVEKLGGRLKVKSEPGKGSLFYFELPYKAEDASFVLKETPEHGTSTSVSLEAIEEPPSTT